MADTKLTNLASKTSPDSTDNVYIVDNDGTPESKKSTLGAAVKHGHGLADGQVVIVSGEMTTQTALEKASVTEAVSGVDNEKYMTPYATAAAIENNNSSLPYEIIRSVISSAYLPIYTDDLNNVSLSYTNDTLILASNVSGGARKYKNGNIQEITGTLINNSVITFSSCLGTMVRDGYVTGLFWSSASSIGKIYRCLVDNDISVYTNWQELSFSGFSPTINTFLSGYGNGYWWFRTSATTLAYFTLSGTTFTYVGTLTFGSANDGGGVSESHKVNEQGIYLLYDTAPALRKANFNGSLDPNKQWGSNVSHRTPFMHKNGAYIRDARTSAPYFFYRID